MAAGTTTDTAYLSKIIYPGGYDAKQLVRDKPALANTPHKKNFTSAEGISFPAGTANGQGASAVVATAQSNVSPSVGQKFLVPQVSYYTQVTLQGKVVRNAMNGNSDSYFMDQLKVNMDGAQETMGVELNRQIFGSQDGWRAQVGSAAPSGTTAILANFSDCVFFEKNMVVVFASTAGGAIRAGTPGYAKITAVDDSTGTLTFDGTITTLITTPGAGDYIFRQGDARNNGTAVVSASLYDWNPPSTSGLGTPFMGVTRSDYPSRLAGPRYTGTGDPIQTVFIKAFQSFKTQVGPGWKNGDIYIHPLNMSQLMSAVEGGRVTTGEKMTSYGIGIPTFKYMNMTFIEDSLCQLNTAKVVAEGAFVRASCGDQPIWSSDANGSEFKVDMGTDLFYGSLIHDGNFAGMKVNQLGHIALPVVS